MNVQQGCSNIGVFPEKFNSFSIQDEEVNLTINSENELKKLIKLIELDVILSRTEYVSAVVVIRVRVATEGSLPNVFCEPPPASSIPRSFCLALPPPLALLHFLLCVFFLSFCG